MDIILRPMPTSLFVEENGASFSIPLVDLRSSNWEEMRGVIAEALLANESSMQQEDLDDERVKSAIMHAVMFGEPLHIEVRDDAD